MKKGLKSLVIFTFSVLIGFLILAFSRQNYEFLVYWLVVVVFFLIILKLDKKFNFPIYSLWLFSLWVISHMAGGLIFIKGIKLYDTMLISLVGEPFLILKYNQVIHTFCYVAITILVYFAMKNYMKDKRALFILSVLAGLGIGAVNEMIEFSMVVFADAGAAVGGYYNNSLDLIFNFMGNLLGAWIASKIKNK